MQLKLDHVVYFTHKSPDEIVDQLQQDGQHAVVGGRHEKWGTHNALMYVKNAYIEWLAVEKLELAERVDHPLTRLLLHDVKIQEGWGTLCLSVENIEAFNEELQNKGFLTSGVLDAQRRTTSGEIKRWKMLFINQPISNELPYPFFIEWEEPEQLRFDKLRAEGALVESNEKKVIQQCVFHVEDPLGVTGEWAVLLSAKVDDNHTISLNNVTLRFIEHEGGVERLKEVVISTDK
ncbi:VOC family protein [Sporosarcina saromensis]|uniref:VOC family protein n=1 Tax=Sporosarcina saromensis TaxID=359365 RepID=A0ABU4GB69_9BACL|nr:VOC family protein [Sporosarcina saromensis]MDW0114244.1 VOC family protein [Sporosarcina saromensis]